MEGSRKQRRYRAMTWIWALGAAALLLLPSHALPGDELPGLVTAAIELAVHVALFCGLAGLARRGYAPASSRISGRSRSRLRGRRRLLVGVLAYCLALELLQLAVPGRGFELVDVAAGWLGAVLGLARTD